MEAPPAPSLARGPRRERRQRFSRRGERKKPENRTYIGVELVACAIEAQHERAWRRGVVRRNDVRIPELARRRVHARGRARTQLVLPVPLAVARRPASGACAMRAPAADVAQVPVMEAGVVRIIEGMVEVVGVVMMGDMSDRMCVTGTVWEGRKVGS